MVMRYTCNFECRAGHHLLLCIKEDKINGSRNAQEILIQKYPENISLTVLMVDLIIV